MPAHITEDSLELSIGLLEVDLPNQASYPFPTLGITDRTTKRTFRTLNLENPLLRVTIVPALGGRILSILDRRTGKSIFGDGNTLRPIEGGRRGVVLSAGIELVLDKGPRLNSLGPVSYQFDEPEEETNAARVWLAETSMAIGLAYHVRFSIPPDRAEVHVEARVHNRTFRPLPYNGGLLAYAPPYDEDADVGLAIYSSDLCSIDPGFARFPRTRSLAPRQVDTWHATLVPWSGLGKLTAHGPELAIGLTPDHLRIQSTTARKGDKIVLATASGKTLEAPVELYAEHVTSIPLAGIGEPVTAVAILDARGRELLRSDSGPLGQENGRRAATLTPALSHGKGEGDLEWPTVDDAPAVLAAKAFDLPTRHLAHTALGIRALRVEAYGEADAHFERALMYNADDPLLWWEKALAVRLSAAGEDDQAELMNGHFLAPLEPALRAEAFFRQPMSDSRDKNPLITPLAEIPEDLIEVACLLIERGRLDLAARWIEEALRHRDLAMLHVLLAYCLFVGPRMEAEAAERLSRAEAAERPPYPWREIETAALETLSARFPENAILAELVSMARDRYVAEITS